MASTGSYSKPTTMTSQKGTISSGFRPELFTVIAGSFATDPLYTVNAILINSYKDIQFSRGSTTVPVTGAVDSVNVNSTEGCEIQTVKNKSVSFTLSICLDGNNDPGFGPSEELRIRPFQVGFDKPAHYMKPLPIGQRGRNIFFNNVEIVNKEGDSVAPSTSVGPGTWMLGARLLKNGYIALTKRDLSTVGVQELSLNAGDIDDGYATISNVIFINIKGSYIGA